jgi:predicted negative regulator of RcsB-dependent stress response
MASSRELLEAARHIHYSTRDPARATLAYEEALEATAGAELDVRAEIFLELGNLRLEQGWMGDASTLLTDARNAAEVAARGILPRIEATLGEIALRSGDVAAARRAVTRAVRLAKDTPALGLVLLMSARVAQDDGEPEEASARLTRAAEIFRADGDTRREFLALVRMGLVLTEFRKYDAALALLEDARQRMPEDMDPLVRREAWLYSAAALSLSDRLDDAVRAMEQARAFPGSGTSARHARHIVGVFDALVTLKRSGDIPRARQALLAAETPGADGIAAVNCFYIVRAGARLLRAALPAQSFAQKAKVALNGSWFQLPDGRTITLGHRPTLSRILARLASSEGELAVYDLLEAGWPGESTRGTSGQLRVYTAVARLRRLGLETALRGDARGYSLDAVRVADAEATE